MFEGFQYPVDIFEKIKGSWVIIPKRWGIDRTFSYLKHP